MECYPGAPSPKPTELLGTMRLASLPDKCEHPFRNWIAPWSGKRLWQTHPPLRGTQRAILVGQWRPSMLRRCMLGGEFLTSTAAAYPQGLNAALAEDLVVMAREAFLAQLPQSDMSLIGSRPSARVGSSWRGPDACADSHQLQVLRDPFVGPWKNSLVCESVHKRWFLDRARSHLADIRKKRTAIAECPAQPTSDRVVLGSHDWGPCLSIGDQIVWTLPFRGGGGVRNRHRRISGRRRITTA